MSYIQEEGDLVQHYLGILSLACCRTRRLKWKNEHKPQNQQYWKHPLIGCLVIPGEKGSEMWLCNTKALTINLLEHGIRVALGRVAHIRVVEKILDT